MPVGIKLSLDYLKDHIYTSRTKIISRLFLAFYIKRYHALRGP